MKASELKREGDDNLAMTLAETEKHLFQLRFQSATDRLETPSEIKKARRDIARIRTEQRARQLAELGKKTDAEIAELATLAEAGEATKGVPFRGRRMAVRATQRFAKIQATRAVKTPAVKGK